MDLTLTKTEISNFLKEIKVDEVSLEQNERLTPRQKEVFLESRTKKYEETKKGLEELSGKEFNASLDYLLERYYNLKQGYEVSFALSTFTESGGHPIETIIEELLVFIEDKKVIKELKKYKKEEKERYIVLLKNSLLVECMKNNYDTTNIDFQEIKDNVKTSYERRLAYIDKIGEDEVYSQLIKELRLSIKETSESVLKAKVEVLKNVLIILAKENYLTKENIEKALSNIIDEETMKKVIKRMKKNLEKDTIINEKESKKFKNYKKENVIFE